MKQFVRLDHLGDLVSTSIMNGIVIPVHTDCHITMIPIFPTSLNRHCFLPWFRYKLTVTVRYTAVEKKKWLFYICYHVKLTVKKVFYRLDYYIWYSLFASDIKSVFLSFSHNGDLYFITFEINSFNHLHTLKFKGI